MSDGKLWYSFHGEPNEIQDVLAEVLDDESGVRIETARNSVVFALTEKTWGELREEFDEVATVGVCTQRNKLEQRSKI